MMVRQEETKQTIGKQTEQPLVPSINGEVADIDTTDTDVKQAPRKSSVILEMSGADQNLQTKIRDQSVSENSERAEESVSIEEDDDTVISQSQIIRPGLAPGLRIGLP